MNYFWVNLGGTHKEVIEGNFLWAPEKMITKAGSEKRLNHWTNVSTVKTGDLVFCCYKQNIRFVAQATAPAYKSPQPESRAFNAWHAEGFRVDVKIDMLSRPFCRDDISADFIARFDDRAFPRIFDTDGKPNQIYMATIPADAGLFLLETVEKLGVYEDQLIDEGTSAKKIDKTTRLALVQARIGQGQFRKNLLKRWQGRCALSGLQHPEMLIASHIVAWSLCNNEARLDIDNGLLLAAHVDRLFDRGLISFYDKGTLLFSDQFNQADRGVVALTGR